MGPNQKILDYIIICSNINKENMVFIDKLSNSEVDISELIKFSYKYGEIDKCLERLNLIAQRLSKFKKSNQVWISKEITIYIKAMLNYIRNNDKHKVKYLLDSIYKKCIKKDNICKLRVIQEFDIFYIDNKRYKCEVCKSFNSDDKILLINDRNNVLIKDILGILFKNGKAKVYKKGEQISNKDLLDMELGIIYNNRKILYAETHGIKKAKGRLRMTVEEILRTYTICKGDVHIIYYEIKELLKTKIDTIRLVKYILSLTNDSIRENLFYLNELIKTLEKAEDKDKIKIDRTFKILYDTWKESEIYFDKELISNVIVKISLSEMDGYFSYYSYMDLGIWEKAIRIIEIEDDCRVRLQDKTYKIKKFGLDKLMLNNQRGCNRIGIYEDKLDCVRINNRHTYNVNSDYDELIEYIIKKDYRFLIV